MSLIRTARGVALFTTGNLVPIHVFVESANGGASLSFVLHLQKSSFSLILGLGVIYMSFFFSPWLAAEIFGGLFGGC